MTQVMPSPREIFSRVWSGVVPADVCEAVIAEATGVEAFEGTVVDRDREGGRLDHNIRKTLTVGLDGGNWASSLIVRYADLANQEIWNFDVNQLESPFSLLRYEQGGHFDWHSDVLREPASSNTPFGPVPAERKLSVTINLSDPDDYDGGRFEVATPHGKVITSPELAARGSVVVFPSTVVHRVTPVTRGTRWALVGWLLGPQLR
ncbi:2OG-Fe(II) oxygenase [Nocardioides kongjuensis]|uniref:PKHD-type hydroxylase n=1 Tax=Nocardioides kongjuensis TaxID=349522 RepID=A0A852RCN5_9ACTN|nr:2OG-Fe(II) oxygenase [Nocardioides kongjuensis]NYD32763.1 PKHD-type hydroxylase [Nocardioides kongjuensis]